MLKQSRYNIFYNIDGEDWLFNTSNLGLVQIGLSIIKYLTNETIDLGDCPVDVKDELEELEEGGFLTQINVDELKVLRYIYDTDKHNKDFLSITILPTLDCNCCCYYCFEIENTLRTRKSGLGSLLDIEKEVLVFLESKIQETKNLSVAWFGGEPLLRFDVIEYFSSKIIDIANKYGVNYTASLTTNGYYLSSIPDIVHRLKQCHIDSFQITLDGAPEDHNQIRRLKNNSGTTFNKMLEGIELLYRSSFNISVRINVSKKNYKNLTKLFDILEDKGLKNLKIYFGQLIDYSDSYHSQLYFSQEEYAKAIEELYSLLKKRKFRYGLDDHYPVNARPCIANRIDSAIIDCFGNIYKCRSQVGEFEKRIGNVCELNNQTIDEALREINWFEWNPFQYSKCRECVYLPLCMGGCPYSLYDDDDALPKCDAWKYNLEFFIKQKIFSLKEEAVYEKSEEQDSSCT
jgi:uncharacterized protein